jgi:GAF domain-containing protein
MQRRGGNEQPVKGQNANKPEARNAPTAPVSTVDLQEQLDRRTRERDEALDQLAATSEVLKVISSSPGDLKPVFEAMLANAARICEARFAILYLHDGNAFRAVAATHDAPPAYVESRKRHPVIRPPPDAPLGRVASTKQIVHIADLSKLQSYIEHHPFVVAAVELGGFRTALGVPLLKDNDLVGSMTIFRQEVRPFTDKQIELVKNFAAQAVIAIENTRLLSELRQRTDDLTESLEQQTATSEVLKVISSSPGELEPVFNAMLANATRICEAKFGVLYLREGGAFRAAVTTPNAPPEYVKARKPELLLNPPPDGPLRRITATKQVVQIADLSKLQSYLERHPFTVAAVELGRFRTALGVPMLKDGEVVGAITILRQEVRPFTDKQVKLMENFAAQAVIAIENTRLLSELRESLQQQTATADVLKVISRSTFDLQAVLDALVESAARLCAADKGAIQMQEGDVYRIRAHYGLAREAVQYALLQPLRPDRSSVTGRVALDGKTVHMPDVLADPEYRATDCQQAFRYRTILGVPLLRDGTTIGVFSLLRDEVSPFTEKQIELVTTFADQAVIAIENARLLNELRESLQQQTATADVLKVISRSPGQLEPVFKAMLENAVRICGAKFGILFLSEGDAFRTVALHGAPPAYAEARRREPVFRPNPGMASSGVARTKQPVQIADIRAEPAYTGDPQRFAILELAGARTMLNVPMLKEDELVGQIAIYRQEVRPFTDKQIELVKNFAAQAVIAIENTRLLNELRESLQQQTGTSEVLKVISSSPGDVAPVFGTMLEKAVRICDASFGMLFRAENGAVSAAAMFGVPPAFVEFWQRGPQRPGPQTALGRIIETRQTVHIADVKAEPAYVEGEPVFVAAVSLGGFRTILAVPMLKDDELVGVIAIYRQEVRPFNDKQIELLTNFAAQAVIAIENTRLLNELRESLQQQTATADVLKVISRSTFDLKGVLRTLAESAAQLCEAQQAIVTQRGDDGLYRFAASFGYPDEFEEYMKQNPLAPGRATTTGRVALEGKIIHIPDVLADREYVFPKGQQLGGYRSNLGVPLLRDRVPIGAFVLTRPIVKPFTDKQIELVETFADQAVIAIENARLLNELRQRTDDLSEALKQQTATADVLKAISRSTFDLKKVLDALVEAAARLCEADQGTIARERDGMYQRVATYGFSDDFAELVKNLPVRPERGTATGRALLEGKVVHIPDVLADPGYTFVEAQKRGGFRTVLSVPMLRERVPIGVLALTRREVRPFTDKQIELVSTFADQAAIAIENVRLFESVEARTRELAASLEDLRTTQDRLVQTQKLASLGQLTAGIAHEIKNPLNFVNNFSAVSVELIDELRQALSGAHLDSKLRAEISEIADTLQGNLDKVVQHGKRADAIVKNMLLHSREGSGEHRPVDINALVEESLNLAYHGARAEKQGFNITLERSLDPAAGQADVFPQDITRVLLNLISNGFYAATKRKAQADGDGYEPTLAAGTRNLGDRVEISVRDNGMGIPPEVKEKMFNPFFTTKPAGEGTGLGLSISHDIIVKQHGGSIEVDTKPGEFTKIRIILPRAAMLSTERA